ncbi:MAG: SET domain-containing protein-lysine N-methyltransferase [Bacteroidia bacterium]
MYTIELTESEYLYINTSQLPKAGNGLFTAILLEKNDIISYFEGEILSNKEADKRITEKKDQYFISLLNGKIMDSMQTDCFAKYANDADGFSKTNFSNNSKITLDEENKVCLIATRTIEANEEVFCSYGKKYWKNKNSN